MYMYDAGKVLNLGGNMAWQGFPILGRAHSQKLRRGKEKKSERTTGNNNDDKL